MPAVSPPGTERKGNGHAAHKDCQPGMLSGQEQHARHPDQGKAGQESANDFQNIAGAKSRMLGHLLFPLVQRHSNDCSNGHSSGFSRRKLA